MVKKIFFGSIVLFAIIVFLINISPVKAYFGDCGCPGANQDCVISSSCNVSVYSSSSTSFTFKTLEVRAGARVRIVGNKQAYAAGNAGSPGCSGYGGGAGGGGGSGNGYTGSKGVDKCGANGGTGANGGKDGGTVQIYAQKIILNGILDASGEKGGAGGGGNGGCCTWIIGCVSTAGSGGGGGGGGGHGGSVSIFTDVFQGTSPSSLGVDGSIILIGGNGGKGGDGYNDGSDGGGGGGGAGGDGGTLTINAKESISWTNHLSNYYGGSWTANGMGGGGSGYEGCLTKPASSSGASGTETITVADKSAQFVSQTMPSAINIGETKQVSVTMKNTGGSTWTSGYNYKLGSQNPQDNSVWGLNRVEIPAGVSVAPTQQYTFTFTITAPSTRGIYNFQWKMVQDGGAGWFGGASSNIAVTVVDAQAPAVHVLGAPSNWNNTYANAYISCTDNVACDSASLRIKNLSSSIDCSRILYNDYVVYTNPITISDYSWICGAAKDSSGNIGFSSATEFKIDSIKPVLVNISHFPMVPKVQEPISISASAGDALSGIKNITIYVDGIEQTTCTQAISCQNIFNPLTGMIIASVRAEDIIVIDPEPIPEAHCGDGSCNFDFGETCSTCPADCGACLGSCMICEVSRSYAKARTHSYNVVVYDNAGNMNESGMKNFTVISNPLLSCSENNGTKCNAGEYCLGGIFVNTSDGSSGANAGTAEPGAAKCCDGLSCISGAPPFCNSPIGIEYNTSIADCPDESKITSLVQVSIPGLECCSVTPLILPGFNVYWSRQTSGYSQLTEASEGDSLYCIATNAAGQVNFEVKKPSATIPLTPVPAKIGITLYSILADETGTFTCNATDSNGNSAVATIEVTSVEKSAVALPFFGFFEFIMALMLIIIYQIGKEIIKKKKSGGSR